jgi:hypothetical protein
VAVSAGTVPDPRDLLTETTVQEVSSVLLQSYNILRDPQAELMIGFILASSGMTFLISLDKLIFQAPRNMISILRSSDIEPSSDIDGIEGNSGPQDGLVHDYSEIIEHNKIIVRDIENTWNKCISQLGSGLIFFSLSVAALVFVVILRIPVAALIFVPLYLLMGVSAANSRYEVNDFIEYKVSNKFTDTGTLGLFIAFVLQELFPSISILPGIAAVGGTALIVLGSVYVDSSYLKKLIIRNGGIFLFVFLVAAFIQTTIVGTSSGLLRRIPQTLIVVAAAVAYSAILSGFILFLKWSETAILLITGWLREKARR